MEYARTAVPVPERGLDVVRAVLRTGRKHYRTGVAKRKRIWCVVLSGGTCGSRILRTYITLTAASFSTKSGLMNC